MLYKYQIWEDDEEEKEYDGVIWGCSTYESHVEKWSRGYRATVYLSENDPEAAYKIGKELIARYKAVSPNG